MEIQCKNRCGNLTAEGSDYCDVCIDRFTEENDDD